MNVLEQWRNNSIETIKQLSGNEIKLLFLLNTQKMINEISEEQEQLLIDQDYENYTTLKQIIIKHEDTVEFFSKKSTYQSTMTSLIKKGFLKRIGRYKYELSLYHFLPQGDGNSILTDFTYFVRYYD